MIPFTGVGLEFEPSSAQLPASAGDEFYRLDPATGLATVFTAFGYSIINNLTHHPVCK